LARGYLGFRAAAERVPILQKQMSGWRGAPGKPW